MSKWTGWGLLIWFLFFPDAVKNGMLNGLELGGRVLVPSIFPYLVISGILIKTGALRKISETIRIGNFSKNASELLIPSLFCGYPTGARLSSLAYNNGNITKQEHRLLFMFANIPGFGFSVSYLGGLFGSVTYGICSYLSFLSASLVLLWLFGRIIPNSLECLEKSSVVPQEKPLSEALVESVSEGAITMLSLLFFVCFFSSLVDLLKSLLLPTHLLSIGASFLEITTGIFLLAKSYPMEVTVFFCGFSGLSVMFQSLYFDKQCAVNFLRLLLGRTLYGTVSVCCFILLRLIFSLV